MKKSQVYNKLTDLVDNNPKNLYEITVEVHKYMYNLKYMISYDLLEKVRQKGITYVYGHPRGHIYTDEEYIQLLKKALKQLKSHPIHKVIENIEKTLEANKEGI